MAEALTMTRIRGLGHKVTDDKSCYGTFYFAELGLAKTGFRALIRPRSPAGDLARMQLLALLIQLVAGIVKRGYATRPPRRAISVQEQKIEAVRRHITHTLAKGVRLDDLARMVGFSPFHFARLFKRHTGQSVHQYINVCRLARVRAALKLGVPRKQIAAELGFSCLPAFSRWCASSALD